MSNHTLSVPLFVSNPVHWEQGNGIIVVVVVAYLNYGCSDSYILARESLEAYTIAIIVLMRMLQMNGKVRVMKVIGCEKYAALVEFVRSW